MPEGDPVYVEPPEGLHKDNDTVWRLKRALNGLRDASRLFHEHFTDVLTARLGFTQSEAQPTLYVDLARNVFIAVHVDDLIMVASSSQLSDVVAEMKQHFTMKVTPSLSASSTQTYVGARYLRSGDTIWDLPTKQYVTGMLNEHGLKDGERVVTPAVSRNDDDDDEEEASAEEHRDTPTHCWQVSVPGSRQTRHCIRHEPSGEVCGETCQIRHHCVETSPKILVRHDGSWTEAARAKQSVLNTHCIFR